MSLSLNLNCNAIRELSNCEEIPFCRKPFKQVRVWTSDACDVISGIFCKKMATLCRFLNSDSGKYYSNLANDYFHQVKKYPIWLEHGERIIDFSSNGARTIERPAQGESNHTFLKRIYQLNSLDWQPFWGKLIDPNQLKPIDIDAGCCAGMSVHFIVCYLRELERGKTPWEAVQRIAPLYAKGTPPSAELAQIFHKAMDKKGVMQKLEQQLDAPQEKQWIELIVWPVLLILNTVHLIYRWVFSIKIEEPKDELQSICKHIELNPAPLELMGLSVEEIFRCESRDLTEKFMQTLPKGIYYVCLMPPQGSGHAIVFIKTGDRVDFIYDPNTVTSFTDSKESRTELRRLAHEYGHSITLRPCRLKNTSDSED